MFERHFSVKPNRKKAAKNPVNMVQAKKNTLWGNEHSGWNTKRYPVGKEQPPGKKNKKDTREKVRGYQEGIAAAQGIREETERTSATDLMPSSSRRMALAKGL